MDSQYSYMHRPVTRHLQRKIWIFKIKNSIHRIVFLMLKFVFWRKKTASFGVFLFFNEENKFLKIMTENKLQFKINRFIKQLRMQQK